MFKKAIETKETDKWADWNTLQNLSVSHVYDARISCSEVAKRLITLKRNKTTDPDGISPRLLGVGETSIAVPLTNLYLRSLREAKVYDDWKVARLNPIFKKDDESDRGIIAIVYAKRTNKNPRVLCHRLYCRTRRHLQSAGNWNISGPTVRGTLLTYY